VNVWFVGRLTRSDGKTLVSGSGKFAHGASSLTTQGYSSAGVLPVPQTRTGGDVARNSRRAWCLWIGAAELLAGIPYTGSSIWTLIYERAGVKHPLNGFGFLVPSLERRSIMACTWVGTKWVGRVPGDKVVLRCFSTNPAATRDAIESDLARLMNISGPPLAAINHRWPDSMPQYTVGHMVRIAELERRIAQIPGLFFAGNAFHGIGIPDCVRSGRDAAQAIAKLS
jgi:protoporphyrinogen oxidase